MKWKLIDKSRTPRPTRGEYSKWKEILAKEGDFQCVYCCIGEASFGGIRNFHVEHRKPKSAFAHLTNDYDNLFYACGICNVFKSDDWPIDDAPGLDRPFYPDPCVTDYSTIISVNPRTGRVEGGNATAAYIIERLHLNRPQLVIARRLRIVIEELNTLRVQIQTALASKTDSAAELGNYLGLIAELYYGILNARPYQRADER